MNPISLKTNSAFSFASPRRTATRKRAVKRGPAPLHPQLFKELDKSRGTRKISLTMATPGSISFQWVLEKLSRKSQAALC
jgi:hypothetical protein